MILEFNYSGKQRRVGITKMDETILQGIALNEIPKETEGLEGLENYFKSLKPSFVKIKDEDGQEVTSPRVDISDRRDFDLKPFYKYFRKFNPSKLEKNEIVNILVQCSSYKTDSPTVVSNPSEEGSENKKEEAKKEASKSTWKFEDGSEETIETK